MSKTPGRQLEWSIAGGGLVVIGLLLFAWYVLSPTRVPDRVYRVSWRSWAPFLIPTEGEPTGLAAELVREAARRRGIRIQWVKTAPLILDAVAQNQADLFPISNIDSVRKNVIHFTDPYLETDVCLIFRADSPLKSESDLEGALVSATNRQAIRTRLESLLPHSRYLSHTEPQEVLRDVCGGVAAAAFLEEAEANYAVLSGVCGNVPLRIKAAAGPPGKLGLASTFEASAAADAIRDEIARMAAEGRLADIVSHWMYYSSSKMAALDELLTARRRVRSLLIWIGVLSLVIVGAVWQAVRIKREQGRAERAEEALVAAERKMRLLANSMADMVVAYDMDRRLLFANPAVQALTGCTEDDLRRHGAPCWIHPDDRDRVLARWASVFSGEAFTDEYRLGIATGDDRWVAGSWGPMRSESGLQIGVQGVERDISERKRAEQEHARLEEQLRQSQKLESLGILAGGVAHDFNNLLTVINGYSEMLLADSEAGRREYFGLTQIRKSGQQAAALTQQLLAFSRRQLIQPKHISLNAIVTSSVSMFERLIGEDIRLSVNLAPGLDSVFADAGQMTQVLLNLVVNAHDAMKRGGRLLIETSNVALDEAFAAHHAEVSPGSYVQLTVTDTGVGMDEETRQRIFEPFFTTKPAGEGTGLGLATIYGIVRQHKGWIWVYSEPGKGSTFKIHLPSSGPSTAVAEERVRERPTPARSGERLLVVEDQPEVRRYAVDMLEQSGYEVDAAASADEALALAEDGGKRWDLLISDVVLPGMNGRQLADRLVERKPGLKVLFMSGYPGELITRRGMEMDDLELLLKPFTPAALATKVREVLDRS